MFAVVGEKGGEVVGGGTDDRQEDDGDQPGCAVWDVFEMNDVPQGQAPDDQTDGETQQDNRPD